MAFDPTGSDLYREEAIGHHFRDMDSYAVLKAAPLWTWAVFLITGVLIAALGIFLIVAEMDVLERVEGFVQQDVAGSGIKSADDTLRIVASLIGKDAAAVHVGDIVRIEMRDDRLDKPRRVKGRITQLAPGQMPHNCPGGKQTQAQGLWMAVAISNPAGPGPMSLRPRACMPVSVQLVLRKQRIIAFLPGPLRQ
jgi:hypothetical protein